MRVTLIHNPGAGDEQQDAADELPGLIRAAGHDVRYQSAGDSDWSAALLAPADLIVVAGGDGTVGRVAKRMVGRDVPLAVLPMGTANNISRTLGLVDVPHAEQIRGWERGRRVPFDVGLAKGPWGTRYFVEALGLGLFAWSMPAADASYTLANLDDAEAKVDYALKLMKDRLHRCPPIELRASLDGADLSGTYVMFEAMLTQYVGPNLYLAPESKLADGMMDLVLVHDDERNKLEQYLAAWQDDRSHRPHLSAYRGRHLQIEWTGLHVHLDDEVWPGEDSLPPSQQTALIEVTIQRKAVEFISPA